MNMKEIKQQYEREDFLKKNYFLQGFLTSAIYIVSVIITTFVLMGVVI